jgi:pantoate--beta-alanine ligase
MTELVRTIKRIRGRVGDYRRCGQSIGLIPTMGALHEGHLSLIRRARSENDRVVATIFINPTQYDDPTDLERYPRTLAVDLAKAEACGADLVFHPEPDVMYADDYRFRVTESPFSSQLEGAHRAGHFDGVLTVVLKYLNIIQADRAYFGEKDWQQLVLVRDMVAAFFQTTEIIAVPTVREPDGLAMSSRNVHLSPEERIVAPEFFRALSSGAPPEEIVHRLIEAGFDVDYLERRGARLLGAVRLGNVRLIDNVRL